MKIRFICLFVLLLSFWSHLPSQNIRLPVTNYTIKEYGRDFMAVNYSIILDDRNILYAGNANGILEYDGKSWNFIKVREGAYVFSMAKDLYGNIFIGSQNDFGYLAPDSAGNLIYISLSDSLPEEDRFFTTVWKTYADRNKIYFQAEENIFIFEKNKITTLYPETTFHTSFLVNGRFYVRVRNKGLMDFTSCEPVAIPGGDYFANLGIFAMLPVSNSDNIFLATQERGFFLFNPSEKISAIKPIRTKNDAFLIQAGIFGGILLTDGNYAFNTLNKGVFITDQQGNILKIVNSNSGLAANDVKQIYQDGYQNIWCALNKGISRIDYSSPLSFYKEESGIQGSVNTIIRYHGRLYVGTTNGLYQQKTSSGLTSAIEFSPVRDFSHQVWALAKINGNLIAGTNGGLFIIQDNIARMITGINSFALFSVPEKDWLFVGGNQGLSLFQTKPSYKLLKDFPDITEDIKQIARNNKSYYAGTEIWLGTSLQGAIKVIIYNDLSHRTFKYHGKFDGLKDEGWILPFSLGDSVMFGTRAGMFIFNDEELIKKSLPDSLLGNQKNYRGYFDGSELFNFSSTSPVSGLLEDSERIWIIIDNKINYIPKNQTDTLVSRPYKGIDMGRINYIYPDAARKYWFACDDGLVRYELDHYKNFNQTFNTLIRNVILSNDSSIFNGNYFQPEPDSILAAKISLIQSKESIPVLSHRLNDIQFYYSATFYDDEQKNLFSYKLYGDNDNYSSWSSQNNANFTNLREGNYTFMVKAMNVYGLESEPALYSFTIKPPWYRTPWSYAGYVVAFLLTVFLAIQISIRQLRRKNERLEEIVRQRTAQISAQNVELTRQKKEITDSIHYAERIQNAVLPLKKNIENKIPEYFILLKPRDIVSGDFYWLSDTGLKIIIVAADCTGHGVPGAFMSMLGISFLNKIVNEDKIVEANQILEELREDVIQSLKQTGREGEQKDGMDMALCVIDFENMEMEFAGAQNPLYLIRGNELLETKADRMPVAFYEQMSNFKSHKIPLKQGDCFYMFSDGYADQFGGPDGKKFKYKGLKELLIRIKEKPMSEQKEILDKTILDWANGPDKNGRQYDQVDDILIVGIRIG
jgi:serine phosphatase RsbU (regulator of sigma subunit)